MGKRLVPLFVVAAVGLAVLAALPSSSSAARVSRSLTLERNARTREGLALIKQYIDAWQRTHFGNLPNAGDIAADDAVGAQAEVSIWPANPWSGLPMAQSWGLGDFTYTATTGPTVYQLRAHLAGGAPDYVLTGPATSNSDSYKDDLTIEGACLIASYLDDYALDNNDVFPAEADVDEYGQLAMYGDIWPLNPFIADGMQSSSNRGDYTYTMLGPGYGEGYELRAHLSTGQDYVIARDYDQLHDVRIGLKNVCAEVGVQVIKDYVDQWAAAHGDVLPGLDDVTPQGAVADGHLFWPTDPWTNSLMSPGSERGSFTYDLGGAGYTLTVHLQQTDYWPSTYEAQ